MRTFLKSLGAEAAFDPETVNLLADAFTEAWKSVQSSGAEYTTDTYCAATRELLAEYIISAARDGARSTPVVAGRNTQLSHKPEASALMMPMI